MLVFLKLPLYTPNVDNKNYDYYFYYYYCHYITWVLKTPQIEKKYPSFFNAKFRKLQDDSKNVSFKIGNKGPKKLGPFFSLFLIRKPLSSDQKWFLTPCFPLIGDIFVLKVASDFRFGHWKCPLGKWGEVTFLFQKVFFPHSHKEHLNPWKISSNNSWKYVSNTPPVPGNHK